METSQTNRIYLTVYFILWIIIALLLFGYLFKPGILTFGDTNFPLHPSQFWKSYFSTWDSQHSLGYDGTQILLPRLSYVIIIKFLFFFFNDPSIVQAFLYIFIFIVSCVSMFILCFYIFGKKEAAFIASLIYGLNPWMLERISQVPILQSYAFAPLLLYLYIKLLYTRKLKYTLLFAIFSFFVLASLQIFYSISVVLFLFLVFSLAFSKNLREAKSYLISTLLIFVLVIAINSFVVLPFISSFLTKEGTLSLSLVRLGRSAFKSYASNSTVLNVLRLLGFWYPIFKNENLIWLGSTFIFPMAFASVLLLKTDSKNTKHILFFVLLTIISIFLSAGINFAGPFFKLVYLIPFFKGFTEPNYLVCILCLSYAVFIGFTFHYFLKKIIDFARIHSHPFLFKHSSHLLIGFILFLVFIISYPLILKNSPRLQEVEIPKEYGELYSFLDREVQKRNFRVLTLPLAWSLKPKWAPSIICGFHVNISPAPVVGPTALEITPYHSLIFSTFLSNSLLFTDNFSKFRKILSLSNIKYIILTKDYEYDKLAPIMQKDITLYRKALNQQKDITFIRTFNEIDLYKISDEYFLPQIYSFTNNLIFYNNLDSMFNMLEASSYNNLPLFIDKSHLKFDLHKLTNTQESPNITFRKINPTKYEVKIDNATTPFFLVFSENYHSKWKAYVNKGDNRWIKDKERWDIIAKYPKIYVQEAKHEVKLTLKDISYLSKKSLPEKYHLLVNGYANAWYIDPNKLDKQNFTITLYFKPQSLFYLGLLISGLTFIGCLGYLGYDWKRRMNKKKISQLFSSKEDMK